MKYTSLYILLVALLVSQCKVNKNPSSANTPQSRILNEIIVTARQDASPATYQASETRLVDLLHTTLWLSFNYDSQEVAGKAKLTFKPYFYPVTEVTLDARMFIIHNLCLLKTDSVKLTYRYDNQKLVITLDRTYTQNETFDIFIDYTAHPSNITDPGSTAISDAKGLYFINPTRADKNKPRQIWSQGETQSNSGWFPTIDLPNEKMTQDLYLTVDQSDITLSNGLLIYSTDEPGGKRTDYWSQKLPAAPYLTMIAIGEFIKTEDTWRDSIEVNYYLEKEYAPYAKMIFGSTPEMMECFSNRLGVAYPWEKFSQIVVRDFVSGAMENTSAVIHFEPVQHTPREHLDNTWEGIIAHELFHHWFGDLVTCESWSNIPLNESFATYGEYIWNEYKHGKMFADYNFDNNLQAYLSKKNAHGKQLIRYHYQSREDMFDVVSYQKGSRVLHMLRNHVGDDAFFASLQLYLTQNQFKTVEVHNLRLAFEEVTGKDLNWFFNQWFLNSGHPVLDVSYTYNNERTAVTIKVNQTQDTIKQGVFTLPMAIDVYANGVATRHQVTIDKAYWETTLEAKQSIALVNFDSDNILLAAVNITQPHNEWIKQLTLSPSFLDKKTAVQFILKKKLTAVPENLMAATQYLLNDTFFGTQLLGLRLIAAMPDEKQTAFEQPLVAIIRQTHSSLLKSEAIDLLSDISPNNYESLFYQTLNDSAYSVVGSSLEALAEIDEHKALEAAKPFMTEKNLSLQMTISELIADYATGDHVNYFERIIPGSGRYMFVFFRSYSTYIVRQDTLIQQKAMASLKAWLNTENDFKESISLLAENAQKYFITQYDDATNALKNKKITAAEKAKQQSIQQSAHAMYTQWGTVK